MDSDSPQQDGGAPPADVSPWVPIGAWVLWATILASCWVVVGATVWGVTNRFDPEDVACSATMLLLGGVGLLGWLRLETMLAGGGASGRVPAPGSKRRRLLVPGLAVAVVLGVLSGLYG